MRFFLFLIMILLSFENLSSTEEDSDTLTLKGNFNGDCYYDLLFLKKDSTVWMPKYIVWRTSLTDTNCIEDIDTNYFNIRKDTTWYNFGNQRILSSNIAILNLNNDTCKDMFFYFTVKNGEDVNTHIFTIYSQYYLDTLSTIDLTNLAYLSNKPFQVHEFTKGVDLLDTAQLGSLGTCYEIKRAQTYAARKGNLTKYKEDTIKLYPNPCNENISIDFSNSSEEINWIYIYNSESKLILSEKIDNMAEKIQNINTFNFSSGAYSLKMIYKNNKSQVLPFIVIH